MRVYADAEDLAQAARAEFLRRARDLIEGQGRFSVALAGGSTPRRLYELLTESELDWSRVHVFFSDERCVPPDDSASNYRMVREALLDVAPIPADNVHRMRGELDPEAAASAYEDELRRFFGPEAVAAPAFDLVLLGVGSDGHTASLFPGTPALEERERWVVANPVAALDTVRLTLTLPVLDAARAVLFLVAGESKQHAVAQVFAERADLVAVATPLPASRVQPAAGRLLWLLDRAAAGG